MGKFHVDEQPEGRVSINAERIRDLVCRADNDSEQGGALAEYLVDNALDIADALERVSELERDLEQADEQIGFWQRGFSDQEQRAERAEAERDNARQALDRQVDQLAAVLAELPPAGRGTALGLPVHQQVRDLRQRAERLEAAIRTLAWNERDGRCWCPRSPERDDHAAGGPAELVHEPECLELRAVLADAPDEEPRMGANFHLLVLGPCQRKDCGRLHWYCSCGGWQGSVVLNDAANRQEWEAHC